MSAPTSALLLVGSPRPQGGTSGLLGGYTLARLQERGLAAATVRILPALARSDTTDRMLDAIAQTDLLLLSFPVYVDTLPAQVMRTLELVHRRRVRDGDSRRYALVAITNCGFAEAVHTEVALAVCEQFALETGLDWLGGLGMAMGGAVNESLFSQPKGMLRHQLLALELAVDAWSRGEPVPAAAAETMARLPMPAWLYRLGANMGWRQAARENPPEHPLNYRPFKKK